MARAYPTSDNTDPDNEPQAGEWQALRGELVALLDQVEGRYAQTERVDPALTGLTQRVRNLRDQVERPEPTVRRQEALRTVKRAVDRFSDRDMEHDGDRDPLSSAIAEIRGRQMSATAAALGRRPADMPEFRELSALVGGLSGRLERLEDELRTQRAADGDIHEVASQVEQLAHVVELLAGAVGETGQVKRLEVQIAALGAMIEEAPRVDLSTINKRLDDVSGTVAKLAELQAQQMEREVVREDRAATELVDGAGALAPAMHAIEASVRNVYDRIDSIEKNVALSSGDFEKLTSEMAGFTQAMQVGAGQPELLVGKVDALATQIGGLKTANGDVAGLKKDIAALRDAVLAGMEPRFARIETQIEALTKRAGEGQVEDQLKLLMQRMDETGAQLDGLTKLYSQQQDTSGLEALATMVAERTSDAVTRKAPAPVAMFGADSLKSVETQITGLIKSASKAPDYDKLADMIAQRAAKTAPVATASGINPEDMSALEERMAALFNTAGKDTAERLTRLEAALANRREPRPLAAFRADLKPVGGDSLSEVRAALAGVKPAKDADIMPANPSVEAPLTDPGFTNAGPVRDALEAKVSGRVAPEPLMSDSPIMPRPMFDPDKVERPPQPQSSFATSTSTDPFVAEPVEAPAPNVDAPVTQSSTSTFVAAARRAQQARQQAPGGAPSSNSLIGRALARVKPAANPEPATGEPVAPPVEKAEKPAKPEKPKKVKKSEAAPSLSDTGLPGEDSAPRQSFLTRHRRPLLLAATLVAVSMLALNLVMQRMNAARATATPAAQSTMTDPTPTANQPVGDVSTVAPRVIDMIDTTQVGSINSGTPMSFSKSTSAPIPAAITTPVADEAAIVPEPVAATPAAATADRIPDIAAAAPESFELPPEAIGPVELRQAAADGDARAQFEIGAIYTEGRAVEQNYAEAAKWYERSAAQGFVPAQYRLGNLYEAGTGVEKDLEVAKLWYQRGAEAGNRMAMHNLAALYASGQLGDQEFETAAEWFTKAAQLGMTDSQFNLGMLYARGLGVEQDFEQSYKWFSLAARSGDADAAKARDDIAKSLTADAIKRLGTEVTGWAAQPIDLAANFAPLGTWAKDFDPGQAISTRDVVSKVQQALVKLGFDIGTPDGLAGPKTAEAIKAFESGTGMAPSGKINPRLLAVLGSQPV
jgi:localization factor PodJL